MDSLARWRTLNSHLSQAKALLDKGDLREALSFADAALEIDPEFLAARAVREAIEESALLEFLPEPESDNPETSTTTVAPWQAGHPAPAHAPQSAHPVPAPQAADPTAATSSQPLHQGAGSRDWGELWIRRSSRSVDDLELRNPATAAGQPLPARWMRTESQRSPAPPIAGAQIVGAVATDATAPAEIEHRARERRVAQCVNAAREAIADARFEDARAALAEARILAPESGDLALVSAELSLRQSRRSRSKSYRGVAALLLLASLLVVGVWLRDELGVSLADVRSRVSGSAVYPSTVSAAQAAWSRVVAQLPDNRPGRTDNEAGDKSLPGRALPTTGELSSTGRGTASTDTITDRLDSAANLSTSSSASQVAPPGSSRAARPTRTAGAASSSSGSLGSAARSAPSPLPPVSVSQPAPSTAAGVPSASPGRAVIVPPAATPTPAAPLSPQTVTRAADPAAAAAPTSSAAAPPAATPMAVPSSAQPLARAGAPSPAAAPTSSITAATAPASAPTVPANPPSGAAPLNPPSPPAAAPAAAASVPTANDDEWMVRHVLERYQAAYGALDAGSAHRIWPTVNQAALARAFADLSSQQLRFDDCGVRVSGLMAEATCRGTARYVPKMGGSGPRTESRVWSFTLNKRGEEWLIASARTSGR